MIAFKVDEYDVSVTQYIIIITVPALICIADKCRRIAPMSVQEAQDWEIPALSPSQNKTVITPSNKTNVCIF